MDEMQTQQDRGDGLAIATADPFTVTRELLHRSLGWHEGLGDVALWPGVVGQAQQIIDQVLSSTAVLDELRANHG